VIRTDLRGKCGVAASARNGLQTKYTLNIGDYRGRDMIKQPANAKKLKDRRHLVFTDTNVKSLPVRRKQYVVWDGGSGRGAGEVCRGLHILISPMGAKSYRSMFYFSGSARGYTRHLGRVGEMSLDEARQLCRDDRRDARKGIDPRADGPLKSDSYKSAVDDYVDRVQIGEHHNVAAGAAGPRCRL
jgi:hypothetical protein